MRALVVVCRFLGDVLLATPLARTLLQEGYKVDWLVAPGTASIIEGQAFASTIHELTPDFSGTFSTLCKLQGKYDIAFVMTSSDRPMAITIPAARRVYSMGLNRRKDWWKHWGSKAWVNYDHNTHIVAYAIDLMKKAGLTPDRSVGLDISEKDKIITQQKLAWPDDQPYIQIHPFARWSYKLWPYEQWQNLNQQIIDAGYKLVISAAPHEKEQAESLARHLPDDQCKVLAGELSWSELAALSAKAAAYIGMDTANTHLAASTGTATIALFGPTNPVIWGPWVNDCKDKSPYQQHDISGVQRVGNVSLIQGLQSCVPCQAEGCDRHQQSTSECLLQLTAARVWDELTIMLEKG